MSEIFTPSSRCILSFFRLVGGLFLVFHTAVVFSQPFNTGNSENGEILHKLNCESCHNSMFPNGDGTLIYDADFRKLKTASKLLAMVEFCAGNNDLPWFEEEIFDVTKFLNDKFYQFE